MMKQLSITFIILIVYINIRLIYMFYFLRQFRLEIKYKFN